MNCAERSARATIFVTAAAGFLFVLVQAAPAGTLRQALAARGLAAAAVTLANLDRPITSGAELSDAEQFVIAYYVQSGDAKLQEPLFVDRYDRARKQWRSAAITGADSEAKAAGSETPGASCVGSVLRIHASRESVYLDTHINPSAGCLLVLSPALQLRASLYGWYLARFSDDTILYHRSQVHFAAAHAAEIAFFDPKENRDLTVFPRGPYQGVREQLIARMRAFFELHPDWCRLHDHPCDPEFFDTSLASAMEVRDSEKAAAFLIDYDLDSIVASEGEAKTGPIRVAYVYRHVGDETNMEFRELLWSEARRRFGAEELRNLLEPETLAKVFGDAPGK